MGTSSAGRILALVLVAALAVPIAGRAELVSVPPADPAADPAAALPSPTVLRGSPAKPVPVPACPPGYTLSADYGCVAPSSGEAEGGPGYGYWPDYGFGYPVGGFFGSVPGTSRPHRFAGSHNGHGLHRKAGFHPTAKVAPRRSGMGHVGGFGRR
jgi:hypothetical protein